MSAISPTEYETRIKQLEKLNATLAAEVDRLNKAEEVCRLLTTLDWVVGYELVENNQLILDKAQELALKVMGMDNSDGPIRASTTQATGE